MSIDTTMGMSKRLIDELRNREYEPFHVTEEGLNRLREKLARLKRALPDRIEEARRTAAYGDRSDNAEYKMAKATLRRTNAETAKIEDQIKRAVIITSGSGATEKVRIGSKVTLEVSGVKKIFQILGPHETDPANGRISDQSPLGAALMDRAQGDVVIIQTANGPQTYHILKVA